MLITIIIFILVLSVLVFAHELGHFWMARRFGVRAEEFGFGYPPRIFGVQLIGRKKKNAIIETSSNPEKAADVPATAMPAVPAKRWRLIKGNRELNEADWENGTVYSINLLPLGGFVKIKGENGESIDPDSFSAKPIWQRAFILSAGVSMNVILAGFLFTIGLMFGMPMALDGISDKAKIESRQIQIIQVMPDTPAAKAEIKAGDVITKINGQAFTAYQDLQTYVDANTGKELKYTLQRGNDMIEKTIVPEKMSETGKGGIGVAIYETGIVRYPWYLAIWEGAKNAVLLTWAVILAFYNLFKELFLGHGVAADLAGPVGIATMTGQVARMGIVYLLQFTAMLSINLAVLNFLPIPALDGGRMVFLAIEKIRRRPIKREIEAVIHSVSMMALLLLVLIITFKDISHLQSIKNLWQGLMDLL